ncbi:MAG: hypothetical protein ACRD3W_10755, partial [Terriglobales bacterium]
LLGITLTRISSNPGAWIAVTESIPTTLELLSESFSLQPEYLARINLACMESGIEPGEYLYREKQLNPAIIRGAIICQLYIQDKMLPKSVAVNAIQLVQQLNCSIEKALVNTGWDLGYFENIRQLRDLLLQSGLISERQKSMAYATCLEFHLPFLHALVQRQTMTEETADYVLTVQQGVLQHRITFEEAVDLLGRCRKPDGSLAKPEAAGKPISIVVEKITGSRLGELLVASTIITPIQLIRAVEEGRSRGKLTGEVLVEHGSLSEIDLKRALNAQGRIENGTLTFAEAVGKLDPKRILPPL